MQNKKLRAGTTPAIFGVCTLFLFFGVLLALYLFSKYIPYILTAIVIAIPALLVTLLCCFTKQPELKEREPKEPSEKRIVRLFSKIGGAFAAIGRFFVKMFARYRIIIKLVLMAAAFVAGHATFIFFFRQTSESNVTIWQPIVIAVLFILAIIIDKWCLHAEGGSPFIAAMLKNVRMFLRVTYAVLALLTVASTLKALSLWDVEAYLKYIIIAALYYMSVFILISLAITVIKKELDTKPSFVIPIPFKKTSTNELSVIDYLEENTGITMRGLWSMRFIKQIAPITVVLIAGFLWISTCIIQIDSNSKGAVYRLGVLQDNILEPGIHLVLPYPFDKVDIYNTESLNKLTIGYSSLEDTDNLWTKTHGTEEYKLLLGSGDEVVSINLRLEYKINDLKSYLTTTSTPEALMEAQAYDLVTDETIGSDLATLLSTDRDAFAKNFSKKLTENLNHYNVGIEIVSVVLESIHPPLEIANVYQEIISAEIEAVQKVTMAEGAAALVIAEAEEKRDSSIGTATADHSRKLAAARTEIAEFMAGVEAYNAYSNEYMYHKYLKAITEAYSKANLVIVGDGVDSSKIFFGNFGDRQAQ